MRIENTAAANASPDVKSTKSRTPPASNQPAALSPDQTTLSATAELAQGADPQRLEALRISVETGKFNVSPQELAQAIVDSHTKP